MDLPIITPADVLGKRVLLRADLDVGKTIDRNERRLKVLVETLSSLAVRPGKITVIGHRGRPDGRVVGSLSLKDVSKTVETLLAEKIGKEEMKRINMQMMENLRFDKGEKENDEHFAKHLAEGQDLFVNEAFGDSHRKHASIVSIPKFLPSFAGPHFVKEVGNLEKVTKNPARPVVFIVSGVKSDKLGLIEGIAKVADGVLIGGRLPDAIHDESPLRKDAKFVVADLIADKEDVTIHSIEKFEAEIEKAKTVVVSGPVGKFEDEAHSQGTRRVFKKVAESGAFKVAGGGETEVALDSFSLTSKFDWISVGGGAMLEFTAKGTLPGIEALLH